MSNREREREKFLETEKRNSMNQAQKENTLYTALFIEHNYNTSRIF